MSGWSLASGKKVDVSYFCVPVRARNPRPLALLHQGVSSSSRPKYSSSQTYDYGYIRIHYIIVWRSYRKLLTRYNIVLSLAVEPYTMSLLQNSQTGLAE